jgi:Signal peptidase (SPase) II
MRRRALATLVLATVLAAADLWHKASTPTPPWAFHTRSTAWVALSLALLGAVLALTRVPSLAVAISAGILAGGVAGNLVSAALHNLAVPDPIVIATGRGVAAFNLADVFVLTGILSLTAALMAAAIRHRDSLRPPRGWERPLRRRS